MAGMNLSSEAARRDGSLTLPSHRINPDMAFAPDDGRLELLARMLRQGDPLADNAFSEMVQLGRKGQEILAAGIQNGLATLTEVPPAIEALLRDAETIPSWVDAEVLQRPLAAYMSVEPLWSEGVVAPFAGSFDNARSTAVARVLVGTGRFIQGA